jgi:glutamate dehydrogenase (NAD(P)+)
MEKRFEESAYRRILKSVEGMTGKHLGAAEIADVTRGAEEVDLVNSGLEDTMVTAYQRLREVKLKHDNQFDLRTAAFIDAIDKIALCYADLGIFP